MGKTQLVNTLAAVAGLDSNRIQFTPDLMPTDIIGTQVLVTGRGAGHPQASASPRAPFSRAFYLRSRNEHREPPRTPGCVA